MENVENKSYIANNSYGHLIQNLFFSHNNHKNVVKIILKKTFVSIDDSI